MCCPVGLRIILVAVVWLVVGCANDDGRTVRQFASSDVTAPTEAPGLAVGSPDATTADDAALDAARRTFTGHLRDDADDTAAVSATLTAAIRAADLDAARVAYAPAREGWERIEPLARLVDAPGAGHDTDPMADGWDQLDHLLWEAGTIDGAAAIADDLDREVRSLHGAVDALDVTIASLAVGAADLVADIAPVGVADRAALAAHLDAWDVAGNTAGAQAAFELLTPTLDTTHHELVVELRGLFAKIDASLASHRADDVARGYDALTDADLAALQPTLSELAARLSVVAGAVGVG